MYDKLYKCPVNVISIYDCQVNTIQIHRCPLDKIQLCDIDKEYGFLNSKNHSIIHISNLDRKTYIDDSSVSKQDSQTFFVGYINEALISVSIDRVIGDISDLTIGDISDLTIYDLCREEIYQ